VVFAGAILSSLFFVLRGYSFEDNGYHSQFLPLFLKLNKPELFPNDPYVASFAGFPSVFWKALAWVSRASGVASRPLFGFVYAATSWATWSAVYWIARVISGDMRGAATGCLLALFNPYLHFHSLLSDDVFLRNHLDATSFSLPLALFGLGALLNDLPALAGALWGLLLGIQPLHSAGYLTAGALSSLTLPRQAHERWAIARLVASYLIFALPALPGVLAMRSALIPSGEWAELIRLWYPWHYFAQWPAAQVFHIATAAILVTGLSIGSGGREVRFAVAAVCLGLLSGFAALLFPIRWLISLQFLRLDGPAWLVFLLIMGKRLSGLLRKDESFLSGMFLAAGMAEPISVLFPPLCASAGIWGISLGRSWFSLACVLSSLGALANVLRLSPLASHWTSTAPILLFAVLSLSKYRPATGGRRALAALLFVFVSLGSLDSKRFERSSSQARLGPYRANSEEAERWIREHAPSEALVLAFPYRQGLRFGLQRSIVGEWIDGAALNWSPDFGPGWKQRMEDLGYRFAAVASAQRIEEENDFPLSRNRIAGIQTLAPWDANRVRLLMEHYRPAMILTPFPVIIEGLTLAFRSGPFLVYSVASQPKKG